MVRHYEHHYHDQRIQIVEDQRKYVDKRKQAINIADSPNANIDLGGAFAVGTIGAQNTLGNIDTVVCC